MKRFTLLLLGLFLLGLNSRAELSWPEVPTVDRYQPVWTRAPFTLSSVVAEDASASSTWVLVGLATDGSEPLVFLQNKQTQKRLSVTTKPNEEGYCIVSVDQQQDLLKSSVQVKSPTEILTVRFDPALVVVNNPAPEIIITPQTVNPMANPRRINSGNPPRQVRRITIPSPPQAPAKK